MLLFCYIITEKVGRDPRPYRLPGFEKPADLFGAAGAVAVNIAGNHEHGRGRFPGVGRAL